MEFLLELLFEIIVEGSIELGSEKKVPMPLRILATIIIFAVYFGLGGFFIYSAYTAADFAVKAILYGIGLFMIGGGIFVIYKMFKRKKSKEKDLWDL